MLLAKNKKAFHDFEVVDKYAAGIVLEGFEVKAIREGKVNFDGSFIQINKGIPVVLNLHIGRYTYQSQKDENTDSRRTRRLLLNKSELQKIQRQLVEKGKTAVPLALILSKNMIKLELAVVKGRKNYDKKDLEKRKQQEKDLEVAKKTLGMSWL